MNARETISISFRLKIEFLFFINPTANKPKPTTRDYIAMQLNVTLSASFNGITFIPVSLMKFAPSSGNVACKVFKYHETKAETLQAEAQVEAHYIHTIRFGQLDTAKQYLLELIDNHCDTHELSKINIAIRCSEIPITSTDYITKSSAGIMDMLEKKIDRCMYIILDATDAPSHFEK